jgi:hypothetical protein
MKKTHPLIIEGKKPDRVRDALKHTLRQYVRRERNKALTEGVDFWDFDCKMGLQADTAPTVHVAELNKAVYVEILRKPGIRQSKPPAPADETSPPAPADASAA